MSVLLQISFAVFGALAIIAMLACWRQFAPPIAALRNALRQPTITEEIRLTLREHVQAPVRRNRNSLRHMHRPKPIKHRLAGRTPRRAIA